MHWARRIGRFVGNPRGPARVAPWAGAVATAALTPSAAAGGGDGRSQLELFLERTSYGVTPAERAAAEAVGFAQTLESQLEPLAIDDSSLDARLAQLPTLAMVPYELIEVPPGQVFAQLIEAVILRAVYSRRQLYERVVEFWTDHFNIHINSSVGLKAIDDREVIRAYALRNFRDMLFASARSPAMIEYLDNASNVAGDPNENYARELMELHTLGVDGGYTQQDIREVARCFTGWTFFSAYDNPPQARWTFRFMPNLHDDGPKVVLGHSIPAGGGMNDGRMVLDILAQHPATRRRISSKLVRWFWGDDPPAEMVDAVEATYLRTVGDVREMIRTMFYEFDWRPAPPRFKRPFHMYAGSLRLTGANVVATSGLRTFLNYAGHLPYSWSFPNGYPDTFAHWSRLLLPRWNFAVTLCLNSVSGVSFDIQPFLADAETPGQAVDRINAVMFGGRLPQAEYAALLAYAGNGRFDENRKRELVALALSSNAFQWY